MDKIDVSTEFFEKCYRTYSADKIGEGQESVRGLVEFHGKTYVCTSGHKNECTLSEVRESRYFNGSPHRYHDHDWNAERNYHGIRFKYRGSWWVFLRNKIIVVPNKAKDVPGKQASLLTFV